jgi:hypothetical protein
LPKSAKEEAQARAEASFKRKEDQARDGKKAAAEYEANRLATRERTAKLRAQRLARDAAEAEAAKDVAAAKPKAATKKK